MGEFLLLRFFVTLVHLARLAELAELKTRLDGLLVLGRVIVEFAALGALKLDEIIL